MLPVLQSPLLQIFTFAHFPTDDSSLYPSLLYLGPIQSYDETRSDLGLDSVHHALRVEDRLRVRQLWHPDVVFSAVDDL
jgi:hypothetical protein